MTEERTKQALRDMIRSELSDAGWNVNGRQATPPKVTTKESMRRMHQAQRIERAKQEWSVVEAHGRELITAFANGDEINVCAFYPELVKVESGSYESDLFRFASLLWSIPVSKGYGRRIRYLIRDRSNEKLVGILALGDPVFNLKARDEHIGWNAKDRKERLYNVMDAYVLGAVPPYSRLICGKLIALLALSDEVRGDFRKKYGGQVTIIDQQTKPASLVMVTTTSALGRSSIYNRLRLPQEEEVAVISVGFSSGWGHFHISDSTFQALRDWLRSLGDDYADGHDYGDGPSWRFRTIRKAFELLELEGDILKHNIRREVFLGPVAMNYREYLRGEHKRPRYFGRSLDYIASEFKDRWLIPRSKRVSDWKAWNHVDVWKRIAQNCNWSMNYLMF